MAKRKSNTKRFSQPITIENDPKKMKRIKTNLDKLIREKS
ncbi:hypothetical protein LCGC14_1558030 [marine sediment metagenome]|uniref:Uncharacterized protein n=1 Tax=marine sediment metagenome TaxID=412755 RepID=A0A0F9J9D9_9ZZZZ